MLNPIFTLSCKSDKSGSGQFLTAISSRQGHDITLIHVDTNNYNFNFQIGSYLLLTYIHFTIQNSRAPYWCIQKLEDWVYLSKRNSPVYLFVDTDITHRNTLHSMVCYFGYKIYDEKVHHERRTS